MQCFPMTKCVFRSRVDHRRKKMTKRQGRTCLRNWPRSWTPSRKPRKIVPKAEVQPDKVQQVHRLKNQARHHLHPPSEKISTTNPEKVIEADLRAKTRNLWKNPTKNPINHSAFLRRAKGRHHQCHHHHKEAIGLRPKRPKKMRNFNALKTIDPDFKEEDEDSKIPLRHRRQCRHRIHGNLISACQPTTPCLVNINSTIKRIRK